MVERYIFSGSLPEDATTYVTREADTQLYEGLKAGKFCYVLNSRQTGKSSLRVRIMRRLREKGFSCVAIDLSLTGFQSVTPEEWYVDLLDTLIDSLELDVDLEEWWFQYKLLSPLKRFGKFIEEVLLVEVRENIVIFIDEIDSVLSLNFPTDDFFAFIRACYNQRADSHKYRQISFCLLGVASPSELIADKKRTPFNIGQAIFLKGFQWKEVEPLKKGLKDKVDDLNMVMQEILEWTGGQPFLTQKLCQFVVEESDQGKNRSVEEIVRTRIIANWESNDEPEHLKTIRDRILFRDEKQAGYLLELYQQILQQKEIPLNNSLEQRELQLSGLVVKHQSKLMVTNPIYREVFNQTWLDAQLGSLRPYSENFLAWVDSGEQDKSRLLQGKALQDAEEWAADKNLSFQDKEFLSASRNKEEELDRERKAKEFAEEANKKSQRRIRIGSVFLGLALLGAVISTIWGSIKFQVGQEAIQEAQKARTEAQKARTEAQKARTEAQEAKYTLTEINKTLEAVRELSLLAGELRIKGEVEKSNEALRKAGLSTLIENQELKQAWLVAATAEANSSLSYERLKQVLDTLNKLSNSSSLNNSNAQFDLRILNQVRAFAYFQAGQLNEDPQAYTEAYEALKESQFDPFRNLETDLLTEDDVDNIHRELINSRNIDINSSDEIAISLKQDLYAGLELLLKQNRLQEANEKTFDIMLYIAQRNKEGFFTVQSLENFDCRALKKIDNLWYDYPKFSQHFGFRVQKEIWQKNIISTENLSIENSRKFYIEVGWKTKESGIESDWGYERIEDLQGFKDVYTSNRGNLPYLLCEGKCYVDLAPDVSSMKYWISLFSRCKL